MGLYCAQTVVAGASLVFGVAIALDLLSMDESTVGALDAMVGVGGLVGGFVALVLATRGRLAVDFGIGVILWSAPLLLIVAWPSLGPVLLVMAILGLGNSLVDINAFTIMQRLVSDEVMGRVFGAVESALIAGMALGSLAMPLMINTIGLRTGLFVLGVTVSLIALASLGALKRIDTVALAPEGLELIRSVPLFAPLPERGIERLARCAERVTVAAGEEVFHAGDSGDRFFVIESGEAQVIITDELQHGPGAGRELRRDRAAPRRPPPGDREGDVRPRAASHRPARVPAGRHRPRRDGGPGRAHHHPDAGGRLTSLRSSGAAPPRWRAAGRRP